MATTGEPEQILFEMRAAWRAWLQEHHATKRGVWAVTWRKASGKPVVSYDGLVEEALCYGWIDSKGGSVDDERTRLFFTPRKPGSGWSRPNKERLARLEAAGLIAPAGRAVLDAAKADGSWTRLDAIEDLTVPDDLAAAFDANPGSRDHWEAFPRSPKRTMLVWIDDAKRPETRQHRVDEVARLAARGERAKS